MGRVSAVLVLAIPTFLTVVSLRGDVMAQARSDHGLAAIVAAHYLEHSLDYVLLTLLLVGGLARVNLRDT
jgi:hypothetical protein